MPLVFLSPFKKTYSSEIFSLTTIIGLSLLLAAIILPFFAAYSTEYFWQRIKEYTEQPSVEYYNHYMAYITKKSTTTPTTYNTYFDSFNDNLNTNFQSICGQTQNNNCARLNNVYLTSSSIDVDGDGIKDKLILKYDISDTNVFQDASDLDIKLLFFIKYGLSKKVKLLMTPMIYVDIPIPSNPSGKEIILNGDLELNQKSPIISTTISNQKYFKEDPFEINYNKASYYDLLYYYNKYKKYNYTINYNYEKIEKNSNSNNLVITIEMNIPKMQNILYYQSVYDALKYAWMQYFYIFLPVYLILYIIFKFIIQNNIFYASMKSDL